MNIWVNISVEKPLLILDTANGFCPPLVDNYPTIPNRMSVGPGLAESKMQPDQRNNSSPAVKRHSVELKYPRLVSIGGEEQETIDFAKSGGITRQDENTGRYAERRKIADDRSGKEEEKRQSAMCLDRSFVFVQVGDSLTRGCNSSWLLCQLNWPAKVVDAPETASSLYSLALFLFREKEWILSHSLESLVPPMFRCETGNVEIVWYRRTLTSNEHLVYTDQLTNVPNDRYAFNSLFMGGEHSHEYNVGMTLTNRWKHEQQPGNTYSNVERNGYRLTKQFDLCSRGSKRVV
ncbi:hypothetical protein WN48_05187 [Eufriesea mexicana]|uniref:Uncharacterized protein n=1 Tax=Eufriesea mexicana TaxID=516756 RepID=A0A310SHS5_9HYME|nr:hypothetical protein WN48_05187 [Eufriesea mexicana]